MLDHFWHGFKPVLRPRGKAAASFIPVGWSLTMKMDPAAFVAEPELIEALRQHAEVIECNEDRVLFKQGDAPAGLYIFLRGSVRLVMRSQTGDLLMDMAALEESLLGLPGMIGGLPYSLSAFARKGSEVGFVSREKFAGIMLSQPPIAVGILRVLAAEVRTARMALVEKVKDRDQRRAGLGVTEQPLSH